jgi:2-keto-4-pentenoate hydratase
MDERIENGMQTQLAGWREALQASGVERVGWKIGLNAPPVMEALGIDRPVTGWIASGTTLDVPAEFPTAGTTKVGAEPELAITVGEGGGVAGMGPAIEVVDVDKPFDDLAAILAGNVFHQGVVFGPHGDPQALEGITAHVVLDGAPEAEIDLAHAVDPAAVIEIVGGRLREAGATLEPGDRIICGALTPILWAQPGTNVELDMGPLGAVALTFA